MNFSITSSPFKDRLDRSWYIMQREDGSICVYYTQPDSPGHWVVYDSVDEIICAVCDKPITGSDYDNRHWWHEPDCPNYSLNMGIRDDYDWVTCGCDIETHPNCIPEWAKEDWERIG